MNVGDSPRLRHKAPSEHDRALVVPSLDQVGGLIAQNIASRQSIDFEVLGHSYHRLAAQARDDLTTMATRYTRSYRDVTDMPENCASGSPILLSGHQPELFHPGVWFKNFALSALAKKHSAWAVNLVVDNDLCRQRAIRVPGGSMTSPTVRWIDFDRSTESAPWEQQPIADRDRLASFGQRVREQIGPLVKHPIIDQFWPLVTVTYDG